MKQLQKLNCYVDESGQDPSSLYFTVVSIVTEKNTGTIGSELELIEDETEVRGRKWHKNSRKRRLAYVDAVMRKNVAAADIFVGIQMKPLHYFTFLAETVVKAIREKSMDDCRVRVIVDGIDQQTARKLTKTLRSKGVRLNAIRGKRDENEPLIRLADMVAGCLRAALLGDAESILRVGRALRRGHIKIVSETKTPLSGALAGLS